MRESLALGVLARGSPLRIPQQGTQQMGRGAPSDSDRELTGDGGIDAFLDPQVRVAFLIRWGA